MRCVRWCNVAGVANLNRHGVRSSITNDLTRLRAGRRAPLYTWEDDLGEGKSSYLP